MYNNSNEELINKKENEISKIVEKSEDPIKNQYNK